MRLVRFVVQYIGGCVGKVVSLCQPLLEGSEGMFPLKGLEP